MDPYFFNKLEAIYNLVDHHLPGYKNNPCNNCNQCCTYEASQGVSLLELDYIREHLKKNLGTDEAIISYNDYINKIKNPETKELLHLICPFYDLKEKKCTIYSSRPLSCRTFGYFVKKDFLHIIPDKCSIKKNVIIYTDENFHKLLPFVVPFYNLVFGYLKKI